MIDKLEADEIKFIRMLAQGPHLQRLSNLLVRQLDKIDGLLRRASGEEMLYRLQGRAQQLEDLLKVLQQHSDD